MKILYINVNSNQGSHGTMISILHNHIMEIGLHSVFLYGRGAKKNSLNTYKIASNLEVKVHALLTRLTGFQGIFSPFATRKVKRIIHKFKPDIIHIHELHAYYINMDKIINFIKINKIKTYITLHSEMLYTGKCGYSLNCNKYEDTCNNCPLVKEYPKSLYFDQVRPMHEWRKKAFEGFENLHFISPSNWLISKYKLSFLKKFPITHLNNGIDESIFLKAYERLHKNKYVLAVANKIDTDPRKGFNDLKLLATRLIKHNIDVIVIGTVLEHKSLPSNMFVIKRTNSQALLASYYQHSHSFVILSQMENQPVTVIESLMSGTPVIGYDVGGIKEMAIEPHLKTVPYGKILEIESHILKLDYYNKLEIQNEAIKKYSKDIFLKQHKDIYFK